MSATALSRYVARNPEILSGELIIKGTRTSVRAIVGLWRLGIMPEEILLIYLISLWHRCLML